MKKMVDENYKAFKKALPELLKDVSNKGKFALMHEEKCHGGFSTVKDARLAGELAFKKSFSLQEIGTTPIDLGYFSHVRSLSKCQ